MLDGVDLFDWTVTTLDYACEASPARSPSCTDGGAEPLVLSGSAVDGGHVELVDTDRLAG